MAEIYTCTWLIKATCDAPGFTVKTMTHPTLIALHYYEYSDSTLKDTTYTDFPRGSNAANAGFDENAVFNLPN